MNKIKITLEDRDRKALKYLGSKLLPLQHDESNYNFIITEYKQIADTLDQKSLYSIRRYADVLARAVKKANEQDKSDENSPIKQRFKLYEKKYRLVSNEASRMIKKLKNDHTEPVMTPGNVFSKIDAIEKSKESNDELSDIDDETLQKERKDYEYVLNNLRKKREHNKRVNLQIEERTRDIIEDKIVNTNSAYTYEYKMKRFMRKYMSDADSLDELITQPDRVKDALDKIPLQNGTNLKGYISAILCYIKYLNHSPEIITRSIQEYRNYLKTKLQELFLI